METIYLLRCIIYYERVGASFISMHRCILYYDAPEKMNYTYLVHPVKLQSVAHVVLFEWFKCTMQKKKKNEKKSKYYSIAQFNPGKIQCTKK